MEKKSIQEKLWLSMEKDSTHFLILEHYANAWYGQVIRLNSGKSTSEKLPTLGERCLPKFKNKFAPVMDSLIYLEDEQRLQLQEFPTNFDDKILKEEVENFNAVIEKFNQTVEHLKTFETIDLQKRLLNELHKLAYGERREPIFPNLEPLNLEKVKISTPVKYWEMPVFCESETLPVRSNIQKKLPKKYWFNPIFHKPKKLNIKISKEPIPVLPSHYYRLMMRSEEKTVSPLQKLLFEIISLFKKQIFHKNLRVTLENCSK